LSVFVRDKRKRPLMPCFEKSARLLLERGRAVVHRRYPFTIRLDDRVVGEGQPIRVKLDPGSIGIAVVTDEDGNKPRVLCLFELTRRRRQIGKALTARRAFRRVAARVAGSFRVGKADGINAKYCKPLGRVDGYSYAPRRLASRASAPAGASARSFW
jgi:RRXRR protein